MASGQVGLHLGWVWNWMGSGQLTCGEVGRGLGGMGCRLSGVGGGRLGYGVVGQVQQKRGWNSARHAQDVRKAGKPQYITKLAWRSNAQALGGALDQLEENVWSPQESDNSPANTRTHPVQRKDSTCSLPAIRQWRNHLATRHNI